MTVRAARTYLRKVMLRHRGHVSVRAGNECEVHFATVSKRSQSWFAAEQRRKTVHESVATDLVMRQLGPTDVFFDVGAYLGFYTVIATAVCFAAEVHAFDIDATNLQLVKSSLDLNTTRPGTVQLIPAAIGDSTGKIVAFGPHKSGNPSTQQLIETREHNQGSSAEMKALSLSLDDYCQQTWVKPTFIKMDIEGAEALAINGMDWVLRVAAPKMLIEVHPARIAEYGGSVSEVLSKIRSYGYVGRPLEAYGADSESATQGTVPVDPIGPGATKIYFEKPC